MENIAIGLLIPFLGTVLGSGMVIFMKDKMDQRVEKALLGFASGVMIAASIWSLLLPSIDMSEQQGVIGWIPAAVGFMLGILFLLLLDTVVPHLHLETDKPDGMPVSLKKTTMLVLAVTLHNIPEGMAVGVVFAGVLAGNTGISLAGAFALSIGIAIQNFPEGAIISMPFQNEGLSGWSCVRCCGTDCSTSYHSSDRTDYIGSSVSSVFCGGSHDLCCGRGINSGIAGGRTFQYWNHWCVHRICSDDDSGCCTWIEKSHIYIVQKALE